MRIVLSNLINTKNNTWRRAKLCAMTSIIAVMCSNVQGQYNTATDHYDMLPDLGSQASNFLSEADAKILGRAFIRQSRFQQPYINDPELVSYINRLGQKLLAVSSDAGKDYQFYLIDNNVINAFAVPGGHVALHTGIFTKSESESELASVVGHEIAHITQNHIGRKLETSKYDNWLALGALLAAAAAGGADAAQAAFGVASASILDRQLSYSRSFESEADSLGIRLLSRAGFDPQAMPIFFKRLLSENRASELRALEFLRSHPLTIARVSESSERVKAYPPAKEIDESEFLLMQAKVRASYANNSEQARDFFKDEIRNGDTSLATRYGYALALSKNLEYDKSREEFNKLNADYPNNTTIRLANADNELEANNINEGLELLKELYQEQRELDNNIVDIYYANALVLTTRNEEAIPILKAAIKSKPDEPFPHFLLSRAYGELGDEMNSFWERGEYHYLRGNYEFSIRQFQRAEFLTKTRYDKLRIQARIIDVENEIQQLESL